MAYFTISPAKLEHLTKRSLFPTLCAVVLHLELPSHRECLRISKENKPSAPFPSWVRTRNLQWRCSRHRRSRLLQRNPSPSSTKEPCLCGHVRGAPPLPKLLNAGQEKQLSSSETDPHRSQVLPLASQVTLSMILIQPDLQRPHIQNEANYAQLT